MFGGRRHLVERAVHAVADAEFILERLKVNIARPVLHRLLQHQIDEFDNRHLIGQRGHGLIIRSGGGHFFGDVFIGVNLLENFRETFALLLPVKPLNTPADIRRVGHDDLHIALGRKMNFIGLGRIQRLGERHQQDPVVQRDRQALVHLGDLGGQQLGDFRRNFAIFQRNHLGAQRGGHHMQDGVQLHDAEILQQLDHGRGAALEFAGNFLVLEVVNQPLLPHERQ